VRFIPAYSYYRTLTRSRRNHVYKTTDKFSRTIRPLLMTFNGYFKVIPSFVEVNILHITNKPLQILK